MSHAVFTDPKIDFAEVLRRGARRRSTKLEATRRDAGLAEEDLDR